MMKTYTTMAEEINKNQTELNDEQLDEISGGTGISLWRRT